MQVENVNPKAGEKLFNKYCMSCHGKKAKGGALAKFNLLERESLNNKMTFLKTVKDGRAGTYMKGFKKKLNQKHILSIHAYLEKLKD